jgi:hypothetical protein
MEPTMTEPQLAFPTCILPGCQTITTTPTRPCPQCLRAFGAYLQPAPGVPALTPAQVADRDTAVRAVYTTRRHAAPAGGGL